MHVLPCQADNLSAPPARQIRKAHHILQDLREMGQHGLVDVRLEKDQADVMFWEPFHVRQFFDETAFSGQAQGLSEDSELAVDRRELPALLAPRRYLAGNL